MSLSEKTCIPCHSGIPKLTQAEYEPLLAQLQDWQVVDSHHLLKSYKSKNFIEAMTLANNIAGLAEQQGHHPDLLVRWGELRIELWTHAIDGLSESDFILAAKIDQL